MEQKYDLTLLFYANSIKYSVYFTGKLVAYPETIRKISAGTVHNFHGFDISALKHLRR